MKNCLNPEFVHTFEIDYYFEEVQQLFFAVYDIDNKTEKLTDDDFLGQIQCTLAQVCLCIRHINIIHVHIIIIITVFILQPMNQYCYQVFYLHAITTFIKIFLIILKTIPTINILKYNLWKKLCKK